MKRDLIPTPRHTTSHPAEPGNNGDTAPPSTDSLSSPPANSGIPPKPTNGHPPREDVPRQVGQASPYGSADLAKMAQGVADREIVRPQVDSAKLRAIAIASGPAGESSVRETSEHDFGAANREHMEEIRGVQGSLEVAGAGADKHIGEISAEMQKEERYIRIKRDGVPWTAKDTAMVVFLILVSLVMLLVGINTIATVLRSTGIVGFQNPLNAYLFSFAPIAVATGLKCVSVYLGTYSDRRRYALTTLVMGILLGLVWALAFARTFPSITQSTAELIRSVMDSTSPPTGDNSSWTFIFLTILADSFLAAGCWLTAETIAERHELNRVDDDPGYQKRQADLDAWIKVRDDYHRIAFRLAGKLKAIDEARQAHVKDALSQFRIALKATAQARHLEGFLGGS